MGSRGPAPTPTPILKLRGSTLVTKRRQQREPKPPEGRPDCPDWLDEEAKQAWAQLVPLLELSGVLTRIDGNALTRYCQLWARWKRAELFIQKHGDTYTIRDEQQQVRCLQQFPQVGIAHRLAAVLGRLEAEFGMTPSARTRIHINAQSPAAAQGSSGPDKNRFFMQAGA